MRSADELDPQTRIAAGCLPACCDAANCPSPARALAPRGWMVAPPVASLAARVWSDWGLGEQRSRKARVTPCAHEIERGGGACVSGTALGPPGTAGPGRRVSRVGHRRDRSVAAAGGGGRRRDLVLPRGKKIGEV